MRSDTPPKPLAIELETTNRSNAPTAICPTCGHTSQFAFDANQSVQWHDDGKGSKWNKPQVAVWVSGMRVDLIRVAHCISCGAPCFYVYVFESDDSKESRPRLLYPAETVPDRIVASVPREQRWLYDEARAVFGTSPTAAGVLLRRCLEHLLRVHFSELLKAVSDKAPLGPLIIAVLENPPTELSHRTREAMTNLKDGGNLAAHAKLNEPLSPLIARAMFRVIERVYDDLYRVPAEDQEFADLLKDASTRQQQGS